MRISTVSRFIVVAVAAVFVWLNVRQTDTITEPYYAPMIGAVLHLPPYEMKEMAVSVHSDRGWPIWHTRASNHFAAHNVGAYLNGGLKYDRASPQTDYVHASFDFGVALLMLVTAAVVSETMVRTLRRRSASGFQGQRETQD